MLYGKTENLLSVPSPLLDNWQFRLRMDPNINIELFINTRVDLIEYIPIWTELWSHSN